MIANERQYRISKKKLEELQAQLEELEAQELPDDAVERELALMGRAALEGTILQVRGEVEEYARLRSGEVEVSVPALDDLPEALIKARIARNLTQEELGSKLGLKEQQVQRYEANRYSGASLARVLEIARALGLSPEAPPVPSKGLFLSRLGDYGLSTPFLVDRVLSPAVADQLELERQESSAVVVLDAAREIERVMGWNPAKQPEPEMVAAGIRFKMPKTTNLTKVLPYVFYTRFLMHQVAIAARDLSLLDLPDDPSDVRRGIVANGGMDFESALRYVWNLGVPVVPLTDPGRFHGMWLKADGRNIIALKQRTDSLSRWLFDLLHEFRHAERASNELSAEVVELGPTDLGTEDADERDANWFATEVILDGRADDLVSEAMTRSRSNIAFLKNAVIDVARDADVPVGALANHVAFRLDQDGENWWGAARNLQERASPVEIARKMASEHLSLELLDEHARSVLVRSMESEAT